MKFKLHAGSELDLLTPEEHRQHLADVVKQWWQEKARGTTQERFAATATIATAALTWPSTSSGDVGPKDGFAWLVRRITASGLSTNDSLSVFRNAAIPANLIGFITPTTPFTSSRGFLLRSREKIVITGASLTATGDITINGEATEVSEMDISKLL